MWVAIHTNNIFVLKHKFMCVLDCHVKYISSWYCAQNFFLFKILNQLYISLTWLLWSPPFSLKNIENFILHETVQFRQQWWWVCQLKCSLNVREFEKRKKKRPAGPPEDHGWLNAPRKPQSTPVNSLLGVWGFKLVSNVSSSRASSPSRISQGGLEYLYIIYKHPY